MVTFNHRGHGDFSNHEITQEQHRREKMKEGIAKSILKFLEKQNWSVTTEEIAKHFGIAWNTAQVNLLKLLAEGKVEYKKVGKQNRWRVKK